MGIRSLLITLLVVGSLSFTLGVYEGTYQGGIFKFLHAEKVKWFGSRSSDLLKERYEIEYSEHSKDYKIDIESLIDPQIVDQGNSSAGKLSQIIFKGGVQYELYKGNNVEFVHPYRSNFLVERDGITEFFKSHGLAPKFETTITDGRFYNTYLILEPADYKDCVFIVYQGHTPLLKLGVGELIVSLTNAGCRVFALEMPMEGMNRFPSRVLDKKFGWIEMDGHDHLSLLERVDFSVLQLFFASVDYIVKNHLKQSSATRIGMVGLSGGAWATHISAAMYPIIEKSYLVLGTLPVFLRTIAGQWGDFEFRSGQLYGVFNTLELHVLGAFNGRSQHLVTVPLDPNRLGGPWHELYVSQLRDIIEKNNGNFRHYIDDTIEAHAISPSVIKMITEDIFR